MKCIREETDTFRDREHEPVAFKFRLIHESFAATFNRQMKDDDMTFSQVILLSYLWENRERKVTQKDISEALHIKHPTTIGLLKRLEEKGMLKVVVDPDNKKFRNIAITSKGEAFIEMDHERRKERENSLVKGMTADEIKQLRHLLDKVYDNMKELENLKVWGVLDMINDVKEELE